MGFNILIGDRCFSGQELNRVMQTIGAVFKLTLETSQAFCRSADNF